MNFGSHEDGFSDDGSNFDFSTFDELLSQTTTHPENDFNSDAPVQSPFITQDFHHPGGPYGQLPQIGALQNQAAIASGVGTFDPLNLGVPQPTILALALQRPQQAIVLRPHQVPQTLGINPSTYVNSFGGGFPPSTMTAMPQVAVAPVPGPSQPTTTILSVVRQEEMADLMRDNWPVRTSTGVQFLPKAILSELLGDGIAAFPVKAIGRPFSLLFPARSLLPEAPRALNLEVCPPEGARPQTSQAISGSQSTTTKLSSWISAAIFGAAQGAMVPAVEPLAILVVGPF
ncbi:hypothetical protein M427DRAFT_34163 [Gonapodya prolifera JEL478]|uniref:Uncharacterized protein n=1 Tax=Gonapodya prolifera (strain JEL478) TaxID=1344416 RepID=A0A139A9H0_GONPJ|nr:hypothetical protein M427DRAFT_34163 [Gonapodya prolifera JEL478]|eukprot:KXS13309.1 hypothetical protein M427DRAFT_34163 [Gonapodya prolifera JEL478]